jgi:hypothetical protein
LALTVQTQARHGRIVEGVQRDATRRAARDPAATANAFRRFAHAVHAFSEDPGPDNLELYLAASRALEECRTDGGGRNRAGGPRSLSRR